MEYKITSIYSEAYIEVMNELVCMDLNFRYDAQEKAIFANLNAEDTQAFQSIQCTIERTEPSQEEINELNKELYDLLDKTDEGYIELSDSHYATAEQESPYPDHTTSIIEVVVDAVTLDDFDIVFNFSSDYISSEYFRKADQKRIYEQAIKDLKNKANGK